MKKKYVIVFLVAVLGITFGIGSRISKATDPVQYYYVDCFDTGMLGNHICYQWADHFFFEQCTAEQIASAVPSIYCPHTTEWSRNPVCPDPDWE
jgi:hypothetical protein